MARSWTNTDEVLYPRNESRLMQCGLVDPQFTLREVEHDERLAERDRAFEHGGEPWRTVARPPHPRERREHLRARQQERDAQLALYPQRGMTADVHPLGRVA